MDRRHGEIVEGAGLEESKINTDFVDWLKRWGSPILVGILVMALAYRGWTYWQQYQVRQLDAAFLELDAAMNSRNPVALAQVADDWSGQPSISAQARLAAADLFLVSYSQNLKPGGQAGVVEDIPTPQERESYIERAEALYQQVADNTADKPVRAILHLHALSGLASVRATRGDMSGATELLTRAVALAEESQLPALGTMFRDRMESLGEMNQPIDFPKLADLPERNVPQPAMDQGEFEMPDSLLDLPGAELGPPAESGDAPPESAPESTGEGEQPPADPAPAQPGENEPPTGGG